MRPAKRFRIVLPVPLCVVIGLTSAVALAGEKKSSPTKPATPAKASAELLVGPAVEFKNLTVFPVLSKVAKNDDAYITLDEGLKAGTVVIAEVGAPIAAPAPRRTAAAAQSAPPEVRTPRQCRQ